MTPDLVSVVIGAALAFIAQLSFDRYSRRTERRRYAAALSHEIRRLANKVDEYASSFEGMKDTYDPEIGGFPYESPPSNPIKDDDILIHRSSVGLIGSLDERLAHDILDFYDNVRTLDQYEMRILDYLDQEQAFESWIENRRKLRDQGLECAKKLDQASRSRLTLSGRIGVT